MEHCRIRKLLYWGLITEGKVDLDQLQACMSLFTLHWLAIRKV